MSSLLSFAQWLDETGLSTSLRESNWVYPIAETIHVLSIGLSVGVIMWLDLCLLRVIMREEPVADVIEQLEPLAIGGFLVMFASGFLLLLATPLKAYTSIWFQLKAILLVVAGLNVLYFHKKVMHDVDEWDHQGVPWRAKMVGAFSLSLWVGIIFLGRWFAYF